MNIFLRGFVDFPIYFSVSVTGSLFIWQLSVGNSCRLVYHIKAAHSTQRIGCEKWQMTVVRLRNILYYEVLQMYILIIGVMLKYGGLFLPNFNHVALCPLFEPLLCSPRLISYILTLILNSIGVWKISERIKSKNLLYLAQIYSFSAIWILCYYEKLLRETFHG